MGMSGQSIAVLIAIIFTFVIIAGVVLLLQKGNDEDAGVVADKLFTSNCHTCSDIIEECSRKGLSLDKTKEKVTNIVVNHPELGQSFIDSISDWNGFIEDSHKLFYKPNIYS